ncbi:MAG: HD domain-containing protein [Candidatus Dojkabacteria bacterium]
MQLKSTYPHFTELRTIIQHYEAKHDPESRFIYALDKMLPVINRWMSEDTFYVKSNCSIEKYTEWLTNKVKKHPIDPVLTEEIMPQLLIFLKNHKKGFFA